MNQIIVFGRTDQYIATYLERASGHLHDIVLTGVITALLSSVPFINAVSPSSDVETVGEQQYGQMVDENAEIYNSMKCNETWKSACCTDSRETRSACATSETIVSKPTLESS